MIRFLQPQWLWLLTLLPLALLWRGRRGAAAAVEYSNVSLARQVARETRSRAGRWVWLLPVLAAAMMVAGLARPQFGHGRTEVQASGIDIVLALDVSGSMQAMDFTTSTRLTGWPSTLKSSACMEPDTSSASTMSMPLAFTWVVLWVSRGWVSAKRKMARLSQRSAASRAPARERRARVSPATSCTEE